MREGIEKCIEIAIKSVAGIGWYIPADWADEIIKQKQLEMQNRHSDITGEVSALFIHNNVQLRLKKNWLGNYAIYKGDWKPDPHWTGD
jgi:hypothetical protein